MKVKILAHTPNPERVVASAAKLCYSPVGVDEIQENLTEEGIEKFVGMLSAIGHHSPLEHVNFTFAVEGISRACSHQIVRHRIASFSQQSQRYVKLEQFEYIIPKEIESIPEAKEIFIAAMEQDQETYNKLVDILFNKHYEDEHSRLFFLREQQGIELSDRDYKNIKSKAEKKAIEDARYVFPNACETKMVFTMNTRTLLNFLTHRCCDRAQTEIRELAFSMLKELKLIAPTLFKNAGPT
ncbi:MAG: FAD-dependent thymidylate synthase [Cetobacterium sp.]